MITTVVVYNSLGNSEGMVIGDLLDDGISATLLVEIIVVCSNLSFCVTVKLTVEFLQNVFFYDKNNDLCISFSGRIVYV